MTPSIDPILPLPIILIAASVIVALTIWAYFKRLRDTKGAWRWFAFGLRMVAILLCVLASLRPSILFQTKLKQPSAIVFVRDASRSMGIHDEVNQGTRWDASRKALEDGLKAAKGLGSNVVTKSYRFDSAVSDDKVEDTSEPKGNETQIGSALEEVLKRLGNTKILAMVLMSDGSSNAGQPPMRVANRLKGQGVPVVTVGFGAETAGPNSKDIAVRSMNVNPTVFVKNVLTVSGMISARGFAGEEIEVELLVEGESAPVKTVKIKVPATATEIPVTGLTWTPTKTGETRVALHVKEKRGELVPDNNTFSSFVTVLGGGLNVLYLTGPYGVWEPKYLVRSLDASQKIQLTLRVLRQPEDPAHPTLDADFAPNAFDVYLIGDLPADFLTRTQMALLSRRVQDGSALMMLGGRGSFGAGGWAGTEIGDILPTKISPRDGQIEPQNGLKIVTNPLGLDAYVLKLAPSKAESKRIWDALPPIQGANRLGEPKPGAQVWAQTPEGEPLLVGQAVGKGRVMEFGGETWPWARFSEESRLAHIKFWRQAVLWLAKKEDENDSQVRLTLDRRRVPVGGRVELTVTARDAKGEPMPDLKYDTKITRDAPNATPENVEVFNQGTEAKGTHFVTGKPGDYKATVTATNSSGKTIGTDSARFLVYQDDRELENPAADLSLLKQIAKATEAEYVPPEGLAKYIASLDKSLVTEYVTQKDVRIWDNWWFLMLFALILTLEWFLRKRHGWV